MLENEASGHCKCTFLMEISKWWKTSIAIPISISLEDTLPDKGQGDSYLLFRKQVRKV